VRRRLKKGAGYFFNKKLPAPFFLLFSFYGFSIDEIHPKK